MVPGRHRSSRHRRANVIAVAITVCAVIAGSVSPAYAAAGDLDRTFGHDGWIFELGSYGYGATRIVALPDGKILAAGSWDGVLTLWRYQPDGSPDTTFGDDGVAFVHPAAFGRVSLSEAVVAHDGSVLLGGRIGRRTATVMRLSPTGSLDPDFGGGDGVLQLPRRRGTERSVTEIELLADGGFIVGIAQARGWYRFRSFMARSDAGGELVDAFSDDGIMPTGRGVRPLGVANDSQNVLVAGVNPQEETGVLVASYRLDGSPDLAFGTQGTVAVAAGDDPPTGATRIEIDALGRIVVAISTAEDCISAGAAVVRLSADGAPDPSFDAGSLAGCMAVRDLFVSEDGSITLAGSVFAGGGSGEFHVMLKRARPDGTPDASFGIDGTVVATPRPAYWLGTADADVQRDGKILVLALASYAPNFLMARFLP